jgi:hypothetical protein
MGRALAVGGVVAVSRPELVMSVARSVAEVLAEHVTFEVECADRLYLNLYVPRLQRPEGVVGFFRGHRGFRFASSALMDPISKQFIAGIGRLARDEGVPVVEFAKGQRKDDVMQEHLARFTGAEGVLFVGKAQEKARVFRTERRTNPATGATYPWIVAATAMVNHYYVYCVDEDFGPFFIKFCSYFPYNGRLCLNGHEWAKRQACAAGIGFTELDNGFAACDDPHRLQQVCDGLGPEQIEALAQKWLARLPHPYTGEDTAAGYAYDISVLQSEFSLTQVFDRPLSGRVFFEEVIRENLDIGRPDHVSLVFARRVTKRTPGRFRTRVITPDVTPSLHIDYKNTRVKQYFKLGRALRTETTINDSRDFGIGKRLCNLPALREVGLQANRRLLDTQRLSHDPALGRETLASLTAPAIVGTQRAPGLRLDSDRVQALLSALAIFRLHPNGFTNAELKAHLGPLLGLGADQISAGRMTYELRRLRLHGLIKRIPGSFRYRVTDTGLRAALVLTRTCARLIRPALAHLADPSPPAPSRLRKAFDRTLQAIDDLARDAHLAA